jgi:hypothetical protein
MPLDFAISALLMLFVVVDPIGRSRTAEIDCAFPLISTRPVGKSQAVYFRPTSIDCAR